MPAKCLHNPYPIQGPRSGEDKESGAVSEDVMWANYLLFFHFGDPQDRRGNVATFPTIGPTRRQGLCTDF